MFIICWHNFGNGKRWKFQLEILKWKIKNSLIVLGCVSQMQLLSQVSTLPIEFIVTNNH